MDPDVEKKFDSNSRFAFIFGIISINLGLLSILTGMAAVSVLSGSGWYVFLIMCAMALLTIAFGLSGIISAITALKTANKYEIEKPRTYAKTGLVLSFIGLGFIIVIIIVLAIAYIAITYFSQMA